MRPFVCFVVLVVYFPLLVCMALDLACARSFPHMGNFQYAHRKIPTMMGISSRISQIVYYLMFSSVKGVNSFLLSISLEKHFGVHGYWIFFCFLKSELLLKEICWKDEIQNDFSSEACDFFLQKSIILH